MELVTARAVPRLGDRCVIHFVGEPGSDPIVRAAHSDPSKMQWVEELQERYPFDPDAPSGVAAVLRTGQPEVIHIDAELIERAINDATRIDRHELRQILDLLQLTSVITVPLVTRRGVVGAMQFVTAESGRRLGADDVALAQAAASRVGAALDNMWLSEQYRGIAQLLQRELLPPSLPDVPGVDIAVRCWAAGIVTEAGGDFYDVFEVAPNRWSVLVGDVCGTGPQAAAITAKARHTARAAAMHGNGHVEVMHWVNDAVLASKRGRFCTLVYATIERHDDDTWSCTSVAGGHPLPVLVDAQGRAELIGRHGTLIGVLPDLDLTVTTTAIAPGDTIVLYTDGITDVRPPHGLTEVEMRDMVAQTVHCTASADEAADAIRLAADGLLALDQRTDDMVLMILRLASGS